MTRSPIKKVKKEEIAVLHICSQRSTIARLTKNTEKINLILLGNGDPKEGYVYKVEKIGDEIKDINDKLTGIGGTVKNLYDESVAKKAVTKTAKELKAERITNVQKNISFVGMIIMLLGLCITCYFSFFGSKQAKINSVKIEYLKDSVLTNIK
jgi:hypothetical protein